MYVKGTITCTTLMISITKIASKIADINAAWIGVAFFQAENKICFKNRKKLNILEF